VSAECGWSRREALGELGSQELGAGSWESGTKKTGVEAESNEKRP
jgi:hypothetical protein